MWIQFIFWKMYKKCEFYHFLLVLHDFQQKIFNTFQPFLIYFFFFTIATPSHNDPEGEDVYEDYESSTELQTVNQTNGTGLLKNNQVSIENLKVI